MHISFQITGFFFHQIYAKKWDFYIRLYFYMFFFFLRHLHTDLCNGFINIHSHQKGGRVSFSLYPLQNSLFVDFLMMAFLTSVRWYLIIVSICFSLIISDMEHLFMCFLAICISSLNKCLLRSSTHFSIGLFVFWYWAEWAVCILWRLTFCWLLHLHIFSVILRDVSLFCLWFSLLWKMFLNLIRSHLYPCNVTKFIGEP